MEYLQEDSTVAARGSVSVRQGSLQLDADEITYSRTRRTARAVGAVRLSGPDGQISASRVALNLEDETGEMDDLELHSRENRYSFWGDHAEKECGQSYHIENGRFTTCRCEEGAPSWSIAGEEFDVTVGGYAYVRGGRFNILDFPVLYVPRVFFPVELERQSGFLMPRFGASSRRGFQTLLPFYWAIDKSQDATLALDVETSARMGLLGEYRYSLTDTSLGTMGAAYFNESIRGKTPATTAGSTIPTDRWSVTSEQRQDLPGDVQAYSNVFLVGDDLFLREINTYSIEHPKVVATRTQPYTDSRIGLIRSWDRFAAKVEGTYYQNLAQPPDVKEAQTLQRLPEMYLWGQHTWKDLAIFSLDANGAVFQRRQDADGFRLDLQPGIQIPLPFSRYAFGSIRARGRETVYRLIDNDLDDGTELERSRSREIFRLDADLQSSLGRVFPSPWSPGAKLKHIVEPIVGYSFVPSVGQDSLPFFDGVDRVNSRNQFTYGVATRLIQKSAVVGEGIEESSVRELGRLTLAQTFDINREINPISCQLGGEDPCESDRFSDVDLSGRINPNRYLALRFRSNYDTNNANLSSAQVAFYVEDPRDRRASGVRLRTGTTTSASIGYRFLAPNRLQQVDANAVVELTSWAGFLYSSRYDVVANRFLDNFYGLRFLSQCDCWSLDVTVTDRTNPSELEVRAQVSLVGLGSSETQRRAAFVP